MLGYTQFKEIGTRRTNPEVFQSREAEMTREQFVQRFRWNTVMWLVGFINIAALLPQPLKIIQTHSVKDISLSMFVLFFIVQVAFTVEFFLKKSWGPMVSLATSGILSLITIGLVLFYR